MLHNDSSRNPKLEELIETGTATDFAMAILLNEQIHALHIIELPEGETQDPNCFAPASYDLRLGKEFYVPEVDEKKRNTTAPIQDCSETGTLEIPPFSAVLVSTFETVNMPVDIAGKWDLKIKWAMAGLVFQMGTQIGPGYQGRLFGLLYNLSDRWRPIPYKARLWAVEFLETKGSANVPLPPPPPRLHMKDFIAHGKPSGSMNSLWQRTEQAWKELQRVTHLRSSTLLIMGTVILSIGLPLVVTKLTYDRDDQPLTTVMGLQKSVEDLRSDRKADVEKLQHLASDIDAKIAEGERSIRRLAEEEKQAWMQDPSLYYFERLGYLRRERDVLRTKAPNSPELKAIDQQIQDILGKLGVQQKQ